MKKIVTQSKAQFFRDLEVGSQIQISAALENVGTRSGGGSYAVTLVVRNMNTPDVTYKTFNQLANCMKCFEFEEAYECSDE